MMPYRNIVVGVSAAPTSRIAARHAFELAELTDAMVHVVTAVDDSDTASVQIGSDRFDVSELEAAHDATESFVRSLSTHARWRVVVVEDRPSDALVGVADKVGADLIVVGNVGMQGFGRLLGSVGNDISHHAPCNVLIVRTI